MLNINVLKAFNDNYIFILTCECKGEIAVVDPGDANVVITALKGRQLNKILITHHHADHTGGVAELVKKYNCDVMAFKGDKTRIPCVTSTLVEGDIIHIGASQIQIIETPGHTRGHIVYYFIDEKSLFCGDTLFVGGCGRLFEGTAEQMFNSLVKLKSLPCDTTIYCAHEYTLDNLNFAHTILPDNKDIIKSLAVAKKQRSQGKSTIPSTLAAEKKHNIFLKAKNVAEFSHFRQLKDSF